MECSLVQGELIRIEGGAAGLIVKCISGMVWLTKGDGMDYMIAPGRRFELAKGETALAEAMKACELRLGEPSGATLKTVIGLAAC